MPEDLLSLAESTQTVKLNVGGAKYETTWELLSALPKIATIAYERWIEDAEAEIFIDRDGSRFAYCLDYARDGKAHLPPMISKDALKGDLEFYGVEEIDLVNLSQTSIFSLMSRRRCSRSAFWILLVKQSWKKSSKLVQG